MQRLGRPDRRKHTLIFLLLAITLSVHSQDPESCDSDPCQNDGDCVEDVNGVTCTCQAGFTGDRCQTEVDSCSPNPCLNEGVCANEGGSFTCTCLTGFTGASCSQEIDNCDPNPCSNGAGCENGQSGFTCTCGTGFTGQTCNVIDECSSSPCLHEGQCMDTAAESFTCSCTAGFAGDRCEDNLDECLSNPCENGGGCLDGPNSFTCTCATGYAGDTCGTDIDDCTPTSCSNGGSCVDGVNTFTCNCPSGFTGTRCDGDIDDCPAGRCESGGTCTDLGVGFSCACVPGYTGATCEQNINECAHSPCLNDASCEDLVNGVRCTCVDGFTGQICDVDIDECSPNPCTNGGSCEDGVNGFTCQCTAGFLGTTCDGEADNCEPNPCINQGTCTNTQGDFTCDCDDGFAGPTCNENIDECESNPCQNGGSCNDVINAFTCTCLPDFSGPTCDGVDACVSTPCMNGGSCETVGEGYSCSCEDGFNGDRCQTNINECGSNPCRNGGSCSDGVDEYTCNCRPGYAGPTCLTLVDFCSSNPCQNDGDCVKLIGAYRCVCKPAFTGTSCESDVQCSAIPTHRRRDCGRSGVNQRQCEEKGCCFDRSVASGVPWCFVKELPEDGCAAVVPGERVDCGQRGISREECQVKSCCFDSAFSNVPWCFYKTAPAPTPRPDSGTTDVAATTPEPTMPSSNECAAIPDNRRLDCGQSSISQQACSDLGCCYDNSVPGVPWCFPLSVASGDSTTTTEAISTTEARKGCQDFLISQRKDCGFGGISSTQCIARGCCFDRTHSNVPWCFKADSTDPIPPSDDECDALAPSNRLDCGFGGISEELCRRRGCCYDTRFGNRPWCYHMGRTLPPPPDNEDLDCKRDILPHLRIDCGQPGTSRKKCEDFGCCFDSSIKNIPWCFRREILVRTTVVVTFDPDNSATDPEDSVTTTTATDTATAGDVCSRVPSTERVACSDAGSTRTTCVDADCCYDDTVSGAPSCFDKYQRSTDGNGPTCTPTPASRCSGDLILDGSTCKEASEILVELTFNVNYDEVDRGLVGTRVTEAIKRTLCNRMNSMAALTLNKRADKTVIAEVEVGALLPTSQLTQLIAAEIDRRNDRFGTFPVSASSLRVVQKPANVNCAAGSYYSVLSGACAVCPRNHFQPDDGRRLCKLCLDSAATLNTGTIGATGCLKPCPAGQEFDGTACLGCDYGTYKSLAGSGACTPCPDAKTTGSRGSTSVSQCTDTCFSLPSGYCGLGGQCTWDPNTRAVACICGLGFTGSRCRQRTTAVGSIKPTFGPQSGTTTLTINGANLNSTQQPQVFIRTIPCVIAFSSNRVIRCKTSPLADGSLLGEPLPLVIRWKATNNVITFDQTFEYRKDPSITNVQPRSSILSGGVNLTVTGDNLNSVAVVSLRITADFSGNIKFTEYPCTAQGPGKLLCPTPVIAPPGGLLDTIGRTDQPINDLTAAQFDIEFRMDGIDDYWEYSRKNNFAFDVYRDPIIEMLPDQLLVFRSFWPFSNSKINIKGHGLLNGIRSEDYKVKIGKEYCKSVSVFSDLIICEPPAKQPAVDTIESNGSPNMQVEAGIFEIYQVGFVDYEDNIWQHIPSRIGILCGIFAFLIVVAGIFFLLRYRHKKKEEKDAENDFPQYFLRRLEKKGSFMGNSTVTSYPFGQVATRMFHGTPDATRRTSVSSWQSTHRSNSSSSFGMISI